MNLSRLYHHQNYNINVFYEPRDDGYEAAVLDRNMRPIFSITGRETPDQALAAARREIAALVNKALAGGE